MSWPTEEMVSAYYKGSGYGGYRTYVIAGLSAALAAAPAIDGWVWCERREEFRTGPGHYDTDGTSGDCPGPHRTLLLGPEVEA